MFTPQYQIRLLSLICLEKDYGMTILSYLVDDVFTTFITKQLFNSIKTYYDTYKQSPTLVVIQNELLQGPEILDDEYPLLEEFNSILEVGIIPERDYIKDSLKQFIASSQLKLTLAKNSEAIDKGDFGELVQVLRSEETAIISLDNTTPQLVFSLDNLREIYEAKGGMKSGISLIDNVVGGIMKKELLMLLADTNVGKSIALCAIGGHLVKNYHKVLHVTLEMSAARSLIRYFTTMSDKEDNIKYDNIYGFNPPQHVYDYLQKLQSAYEGMLYMHEMPTSKCTVSNLFQLINSYQPLDVLIIDYLDLMHPVRKRDARRFELADIAIALRGLALEANIAVVTATQTSRQAAYKRVIGKELVAEDYEKIRISDVVVGMGQSKEDAMRKEVVFYLTKSRNTEKDKAERYLLDYQSMRFYMLRQEMVTFDQDE